MIALALALVVGMVGIYFGLQGGGQDAVGGLDCTADSDVERTVFLADFRKPLDAAHTTLPGALLRRAVSEMDAGAELAVYTLSRHAEAPRTLVGRLCKTVDLAGLATEPGTTQDCAVPPQAPPGLRSVARDFCRQRDALVRRLDALALETLGQAAGATYLVEALEATAREFRDAPGTLHLFSDLKQHAPWFSHIDRPLAEWEFEQMATAWTTLGAEVGTAWRQAAALEDFVEQQRRRQPLEAPLSGFPAGTTVRIHYVPRATTTALDDWRTAHQRFWSSYLQGAEVIFDDQPVMADYVAASLESPQTATELAAYELERLRHSSASVERDRAEIERERAEIERERAEIAAEREQLAAERRELAAQREVFEAQLATAAADDGVPARLADENQGPVLADGGGNGT